MTIASVGVLEREDRTTLGALGWREGIGLAAALLPFALAAHWSVAAPAESGTHWFRTVDLVAVMSGAFAVIWSLIVLRRSALEGRIVPAVVAVTAVMLGGLDVYRGRPVTDYLPVARQVEGLRFASAVPGLHGLTEAINDQLRPSLPPASAQLVEDWRAGRFDDLDPEGLIDENSIFYAHVDAANLGRLLSVDDVDQRWLSSFSMRVRFEHGHGRLLLVEQRYRGRQVVSGLRFRAD